MTNPPRSPAFALAAISMALTAAYMVPTMLPTLIDTLGSGLGLGIAGAGWVGTGALLASAVTGVLITGRAARPGRARLAVVSLAAMVAGFLTATLVPVPALAIAGIMLGGVGGGAVLSLASAAIAAMANPDRATGVGLIASTVIGSGIYMALPLFGGGLAVTVGSIAVVCAASVPFMRGLPEAPVQTGGPAGPLPARGPGLVLVAGICVWGACEYALWAVTGTIGVDELGMDEGIVNLILSGSLFAGLIGGGIVAVIGDRYGRTVPLAAFLLLGVASKVMIAAGGVPAVYTTGQLLWNLTYQGALTYMIAIAATLDAGGRWAVLANAAFGFGTALGPVAGTGILSAGGIGGLSSVLVAASCAVVLPLVVVARRTGAVRETSGPGPERQPVTG
ncbi:MFS transporter [Microtetraspora niveoalba]|uniref:MFS transporter n=1 Tax=Microtetraspora niveoalba TaxID=46175 RepID=UPI00083481B7|nr:MFS transporter [Microtetraspora niveoalba]